MADFTKRIKSKYGVKTYQDTKNTYDWLSNALHKGDFPKLRISSDFLFDVSDITCSCDGISEFVENAFGQEKYQLISFSMAVYSEEKRIAYFTINSDAAISICTKSKVMLEKIIRLLDNTSLEERELETAAVTYVKNQINNNGVVIHGDGNVVANNHSKLEIEKASEESGLRQFCAGIIQNIASNFLWYLLTLVAGVLATYFAMK